jgi:manganese/iron transport system permease protein
VGFDPAIGAAIAAVVMIGGIRLVHRQTAFSEDTGIGLLFVGMLGLGVILISRTASYTGSLTAILFGNAFGVTGGDLLWLGVVALVTVAGSLLFYRRFLVLSFNEQKAQLLGLPGLSTVLLALALAIIARAHRGHPAGAGLMVAPLPPPPCCAPGSGDDGAVRRDGIGVAAAGLAVSITPAPRDRHNGCAPAAFSSWSSQPAPLPTATANAPLPTTEA